MKTQKVVGFFLLLLMGGNSSCSDPNKEVIVGAYYTTFSEDGDPKFYFDDPQLGPVDFGYIGAVGTTKDYVVACGDSCYLFPVAAATAEAARNSQIGPLAEDICKQKVFQLTGDSLELKAVIP
jgi:hypothetical protein